MVPAPVVVGMRPLTPAEHAHLDRLREFLAASRTDVSDARALGALLDTQRARWEAAGSSELPEAVLAAFGVGIGDLVLASADDAHWVLRTASDRPAPALLAEGGAAVVPLDDVRDRWISGARDWVPAYVAAAARHLSPVADSPAADTPAPVPTPLAGAAPPAVPTPLPSRKPAQPDLPSRRSSRVPRPRIPADLPVPPSVRVQMIALRALDQGLELACASPDPAGLAFVVHGSEGALVPVASQAAARLAAAGGGAEVAAVVWVSSLDDEGHVGAGTPAVLVEAGERGVATLVVAHRFAAAPVDDLVIVGQGAPLL
ncbi:DUF3806 domain-containing protein [Cellulomonas edaphi]|uniref:DUF3806 domain-containing protein n=1 Tax=Cellulomonas edaphi TaxID=3053468 RepID=A0ABT7S446_9CELL|nr:DUF3806 domain-containing protein [Cellulomons edaphi]MDM7830395.1 DUF3806 domain-containing protein [Cellulomons edaphi]